MITVDFEAGSREKTGYSAEITLSALRPFLRRARRAVPVEGQVSVLLSTDRGIKRLNQIFRGIDKATDVLSFPALAVPAHGSSQRSSQRSGRRSEQRSGRRVQPAAVAGDLAISIDTAAHQASEFGHPLVIELKILMLHGLLHLAGYDHETDSGDMAAREDQLRRRFRLPSSLIARSLHGKTHSAAAASKKRAGRS